MNKSISISGKSRIDGTRNLGDLALNINKQEQQLVLDYLPKTKRAVFDICDINGNILENGKLLKEGCTISCIKKLSRGIYILCIVDGEEVIRQRFEIA